MNTPDKQAKITERIAQLLAKAESTTPEEAEALTEAAEKLMVKYMIDQSVIDAKRAKAGQVSEKIVTRHIYFKGGYRLEMAALGVAVCRSLGNIKNLLNTVGNKSADLYLVGFEGDVAQAEILIQSLQLQGMVATREWWKLHKDEYKWESSYDQEAARRSFLRGFGQGAGKRIRDNRQTIIEEASTGTALVLVDRSAQVEAHFDEMPQHKRRDRGGKGSHSAQRDGHTAGQNANTGERAVGHRRAVGA